MVCIHPYSFLVSDELMNFVMGLPRIKRDRDSILVVIEMFSIKAHFVPSHKTNDAMNIHDFFFKEII